MSIILAVFRLNRRQAEEKLSFPLTAWDGCSVSIIMWGDSVNGNLPELAGRGELQAPAPAPAPAAAMTSIGKKCSPW